jgi:hypothetical protein
MVAAVVAALNSGTLGKPRIVADWKDKPAMMEFTFQATLLASIRVKADTEAEAELKLRAALMASEANLGMLDDTPIVVTVEIEGDLDLIEAIESADEE